MEKNHPIGDLMSTTMQKIREMVDVNTIIGTPIRTDDGITLIPVSKLSFGFASGGKPEGELRYGDERDTVVRPDGGADNGVDVHHFPDLLHGGAHQIADGMIFFHS